MRNCLLSLGMKFAMKIKLACCFIVLVISISASASPILYRFEGQASGSLGAANFTNSQFRIELVGDTSRVTLSSDGLTYTSGGNSPTKIHIDDVGDGTFVQQPHVFDSYQIKTLGISDVLDRLDLMSPSSLATD